MLIKNNTIKDKVILKLVFTSNLTNEFFDIPKIKYISDLY